MSFYIVGTAGHIDHGKTELSKALTGVQTDRLKEEQERGMSIKLGFAPLDLTKDIRLGLVDVPGHEKFIQQMLSGASGMDLVLLVIAGNEGIMPQTREHIDIISLLGITNMIVVLTKKGLAEPEFLELVAEDARDYLLERGYTDVPLIAVDSLTGDGIPELKDAMLGVLDTLPEKDLGNFPRLPVDRVFTLTGHGTIVTGTLWSGVIRKGDQLMIFPMNRTIKIRNIQVHGKNVEEAQAGQRVALNIPDVSTKEIPSGSIILKEKIIEPTFKVTGQFQLLSGKQTLRNLDKVRVHLGTGETLAKLILLEGDEIFPGEEKLAGLYLEKPLGTLFGDHLIIRRENASETLGGFRVVEANPGKIRRKEEGYIEDLLGKLDGSLEQKTLSMIREFPFISLADLRLKLTAEEDQLSSAIAIHKEKILRFDNAFLLQEDYDKLKERLKDYFLEKVKENPFLFGISKEEIKSKFFKGLAGKTFNSLLQALEQDGFDISGDLLKAKGYQVALSKNDQQVEERFLDAFRKDGFNTKNLKELGDFIKLPPDKVLKFLAYLVQSGRLVKVDEGFYLLKEVYDQAVSSITDYCLKEGSIEIPAAKDLLNTSRKFIVPFMEHLDQIKLTKRIENKRILTRR